MQLQDKDCNCPSALCMSWAPDLCLCVPAFQTLTPSYIKSTYASREWKYPPDRLVRCQDLRATVYPCTRRHKLHGCSGCGCNSQSKLTPLRCNRYPRAQNCCHSESARTPDPSAAATTHRVPMSWTQHRPQLCHNTLHGKKPSGVPQQFSPLLWIPQPCPSCHLCLMPSLMLTGDRAAQRVYHWPFPRSRTATPHEADTFARTCR